MAIVNAQQVQGFVDGVDKATRPGGAVGGVQPPEPPRPDDQPMEMPEPPEEEARREQPAQQPAVDQQPQPDQRPPAERDTPQGETQAETAVEITDGVGSDTTPQPNNPRKSQRGAPRQVQPPEAVTGELPYIPPADDFTDSNFDNLTNGAGGFSDQDFESFASSPAGDTVAAADNTEFDGLVGIGGGQGVAAPPQATRSDITGPDTFDEEGPVGTGRIVTPTQPVAPPISGPPPSEDFDFDPSVGSPSPAAPVAPPPQVGPVQPPAPPPYSAFDDDDDGSGGTAMPPAAPAAPPEPVTPVAPAEPPLPPPEPITPVAPPEYQPPSPEDTAAVEAWNGRVDAYNVASGAINQQLEQFPTQGTAAELLQSNREKRILLENLSQQFPEFAHLNSDALKALDAEEQRLQGIAQQDAVVVGQNQRATEFNAAVERINAQLAQLEASGSTDDLLRANRVGRYLLENLSREYPEFAHLNQPLIDDLHKADQLLRSEAAEWVEAAGESVDAQARGQARVDAYNAAVDRINRQLKQLEGKGSVDELRRSNRVARHLFENLMAEYPEFAHLSNEALASLDAADARISAFEAGNLERATGDVAVAGYMANRVGQYNEALGNIMAEYDRDLLREGGPIRPGDMPIGREDRLIPQKQVDTAKDKVLSHLAVLRDNFPEQGDHIDQVEYALTRQFPATGGPSPAVERALANAEVTRLEGELESLLDRVKEGPDGELLQENVPARIVDIWEGTARRDPGDGVMVGVGGSIGFPVFRGPSEKTRRERFYFRDGETRAEAQKLFDELDAARNKADPERQQRYNDYLVEYDRKSQMGLLKDLTVGPFERLELLDEMVTHPDSPGGVHITPLEAMKIAGPKMQQTGYALANIASTLGYGSIAKGGLDLGRITSKALLQNVKNPSVRGIKASTRRGVRDAALAGRRSASEEAFVEQPLEMTWDFVTVGDRFNPTHVGDLKDYGKEVALGTAIEYGAEFPVRRRSRFRDPRKGTFEVKVPGPFRGEYGGQMRQIMVTHRTQDPVVQAAWQKFLSMTPQQQKAEMKVHPMVGVSPRHISEVLDIIEHNVYNARAMKMHGPSKAEAYALRGREYPRTHDIKLPREAVGATPIDGTAGPAGPVAPEGFTTADSGLAVPRTPEGFAQVGETGLVAPTGESSVMGLGQPAGTEGYQLGPSGIYQPPPQRDLPSGFALRPSGIIQPVQPGPEVKLLPVGYKEHPMNPPPDRWRLLDSEGNIIKEWPRETGVPFPPDVSEMIQAQGPKGETDRVPVQEVVDAGLLAVPPPQRDLPSGFALRPSGIIQPVSPHDLRPTRYGPKMRFLPPGEIRGAHPDLWVIDPKYGYMPRSVLAPSDGELALDTRKHRGRALAMTGRAVGGILPGGMMESDVMPAPLIERVERMDAGDVVAEIEAAKARGPLSPGATDAVLDRWREVNMPHQESLRATLDESLAEMPGQQERIQAAGEAVAEYQTPDPDLIISANDAQLDAAKAASGMDGLQERMAGGRAEFKTAEAQLERVGDSVGGVTPESIETRRIPPTDPNAPSAPTVFGNVGLAVQPAADEDVAAAVAATEDMTTASEVEVGMAEQLPALQEAADRGEISQEIVDQHVQDTMVLQETAQNLQEQALEQAQLETQQETAEVTAQETQQETAQEAQQVTAQETQQETQQETAQETQQETAEVTAQETQQETAQETQQETAQETQQETAEVTAQETQQQVQQQVQQQTAAVAAATATRSAVPSRTPTRTVTRLPNMDGRTGDEQDIRLRPPAGDGNARTVQWVGVNLNQLDLATGRHTIMPITNDAAETAEITGVGARRLDRNVEAGSLSLRTDGKGVVVNQRQVRETMADPARGGAGVAGRRGSQFRRRRSRRGHDEDDEKEMPMNFRLEVVEG